VQNLLVCMALHRGAFHYKQGANFALRSVSLMADTRKPITPVTRSKTRIRRMCIYGGAQVVTT
jgi:hypothetical protein